MKFEFFVALRYLRARRKQTVISIVTLISVIGVTAGVAALIIALALNSGFQSEFQKRILGATSHVNLLSQGGTTIVDYQELARIAAQVPEVVSAAPAIYAQVLLQSDLRQQPAVLKGTDPQTVESVPEMIPNIIEGTLESFGLDDPLPAVVLGKELAQALGVSAGEDIRAYGVQGELSPLGRMPRSRLFRVAAIFESGLWEYDANWALVPLAAAQSFVSYSANEVQSVEFRISNIYRAREVAEEIEKRVGPGFRTSTWIELNRPLFSALRLEKIAMFIAIGLIVLVASLNIVSTLTLMVMEKNRDIAIISAMGGTSQTLTRVFMLQGLIIGVVGTILGDIVGIAAAWYLDAYRVIRLEAQVYSIPFVPFQLNWLDVLLVSLVAVLISFAATLYPARAASRLDPVEALRYE